MPEFIYKAVDGAGVETSGEVSAASRATAVQVLHRRGLIPWDVAAAGGKPTFLLDAARRAFRDIQAKRRQVTQRDLLHITRSLAVLLRAGLTMDRALTIGVALLESLHARRLVERLTVAVRSGSSLSQALARESLDLPPYYASTIQAGEAGGSLAETLARLSDALRDQIAIREKVRSALTYPLLLAGIVAATVLVLLTVVLPRFRALFAESDAQLPLSTRLVLGLGEFMASYWWAGVLVVLVAGVGVATFLRSPQGHEWFDRALLKGRWTFGLPLKMNTARLLRTLGTLLQNGVLLPDAVRIARGTLANAHLRRALDQASARVSAGQSLTAALSSVAVFPVHAIQLIRVGEESGTLQGLLLEAAGILEGEVQTSLERLLTLLVPVLTVMMGLVVAGLIGSVLIGLLSINDLAF